MSGWKSGLWLAVLSCWIPVVYAGPVEDYNAGVEADANGDLVGAMSMFRRAADAGHAAAQARLAFILDKSELDEEAVKYYRMSAGQGDADGQLGLGLMLAAGEGVKQDFVEARKWILMAAEQGHKQAVNAVAEAYIRGHPGFEDAARQSPEALGWIKRAADNDSLPAIDALAAAYSTGQYGLPVDPAQAGALVARANKLRGIDTSKKQTKPKKGTP